MLEPGTQAPVFTLPDQDGEDVSLVDFSGRTTVLYFYSDAGTPGCTTRACGVRDGSGRARNRRVVVGVR